MRKILLVFIIGLFVLVAGYSQSNQSECIFVLMTGFGETDGLKVEMSIPTTKIRIGGTEIVGKTLATLQAEQNNKIYLYTSFPYGIHEIEYIKGNEWVKSGYKFQFYPNDRYTITVAVLPTSKIHFTVSLAELK